MGSLYIHLSARGVCRELSNQAQGLSKIYLIRCSSLQTLAWTVVQFTHHFLHVLIRKLRNILMFQENSRNKPLVFSFVPRSHGWYGDGKQNSAPNASVTVACRANALPRWRSLLLAAFHPVGREWHGRWSRN